MPYGSILHVAPTNLLLLPAKQEPFRIAGRQTNIEEFSGEKKKESQRMDQQAKKDKTQRTIRLDRRTREERVKWNQMPALRFLTGETSDIPCLPSGYS